MGPKFTTPRNCTMPCIDLISPLCVCTLNLGIQSALELPLIRGSALPQHLHSCLPACELARAWFILLTLLLLSRTSAPPTLLCIPPATLLPQSSSSHSVASVAPPPTPFHPSVAPGFSESSFGAPCWSSTAAYRKSCPFSHVVCGFKFACIACVSCLVPKRGSGSTRNGF